MDKKAVTETEETAALTRIRATLGRTVGLGADVQMSPADIAEVVARVCERAATTPGIFSVASDVWMRTAEKRGRS